MDHQTISTSLLMASNDHQNADGPQNQHDRIPPVRRGGSGRRKGNKGGSDAPTPQQLKKKIPKRGMGVEKLERIRIQEIRLKKMSETNQGFGVPVAPLISEHHPPGTGNFAVNGGSSHVPLPFSGRLGGFVELSHNLNVKQLPLAFHGQMSVSGGLLFLDQQFQAGDSRLATPSGCFRNNNLDSKYVSGICGELSSTPNAVKCFAQHCNVCHKKKKVNGENLGTGKFPSDKGNNAGEWGFLGLNSGDNQNIIHQMENHSIGAKGSFAPHVGLTVGNGKQDLEIVAAVHPSSSGGVLMEYDFFPSVEGCFSRADDNSMKKQFVGIGGVSSDEMRTCSSSSSSMDQMSGGMIDASTTIDLSLKLSY